MAIHILPPRHKRPYVQSLTIFSPFPPIQNGIADYSRDLVSVLSPAYKLLVVIPDTAPPPPNMEGATFIQYSKYKTSNQNQSSVRVYQIGNNPDHIYIFKEALSHPGVVVLHDGTLHHLIDQMTLGNGDVHAYGSVLSEEFGTAGRTLANIFAVNGFRTTGEMFSLPLIRRITGNATCIIVHSQFARIKALAQSPHAQIFVSPHFVRPVETKRIDNAARRTARRRLRIHRYDRVYVAPGFVTRAKLVPEILEAFAATLNEYPNSILILAGGLKHSEYDAAVDAKRLPLGNRVRITGYIDEQSLANYLLAADLVFNLRSPSSGETSGTLLRAFAHGACVAISDTAAFREFPDSICVKLPPGRDILRHLVALMNDSAFLFNEARSIGLRAKTYVEESHSAERTRQAYTEAVSFSMHSISTASDFMAPSRSDAITTVRLPRVADIGTLLLLRAGMLPVRTSENSSIVVDIPTNIAAAMLCHHGYTEEHIVEIASQSTGDRSRGNAYALSNTGALFGDASPHWSPLRFSRRLLRMVPYLSHSARIVGDLPFSGLSISSFKQALRQELEHHGFTLTQATSTPCGFFPDRDLDDSSLGQTYPERLVFLATRTSAFCWPYERRVSAHRFQNSPSTDFQPLLLTAAVVPPSHL